MTEAELLAMHMRAIGHHTELACDMVRVTEWALEVLPMLKRMAADPNDPHQEWARRLLGE